MSRRFPWNLCRTRLPLCRPYPVRLKNQDVLKQELECLVKHGVLSRMVYQGWMAYFRSKVDHRLSCLKCMNLRRILDILKRVMAALVLSLSAWSCRYLTYREYQIFWKSVMAVDSLRRLISPCNIIRLRSMKRARIFAQSQLLSVTTDTIVCPWA